MKINEKGRSMIEMLGVLAIIGVLSVGGIAGYSKAMAKFKANKTIDLISHTVANTRILFGSQRDYGDLGVAWDTTVQSMAANAKLFPDENVRTSTTGTGANATTTTSFENAYAGKVALYAGDRLGAGDNKAFVIVLTGIPQSACIDLATQDWSASSGSGFVAMTVVGADSLDPSAAATAEAGRTGISGTGKLLNDCASTAAGSSANSAGAIICARDGEPMSTIVATQGCTGSNFNTMAFKFY